MTAGTTSRVPTQQRGHSALQRLVPVDAEQFAADTWGTSPLVTRAADLPGGLLELFAEGAVDELVSRRGLRAPFLRVARDGQTLGDREFTRPSLKPRRNRLAGVRGSCLTGEARSLLRPCRCQRPVAHAGRSVYRLTWRLAPPLGPRPGPLPGMSPLETSLTHSEPLPL